MMTVQEKALWHAIKQIQKRLRIESGGFVPSTHAETHAEGGDDELDILDLGGYPDTSPPSLFLREDRIWAVPPGGSPAGGSGDQTYTAAYASRPSPANNGDLFLPSDGSGLERDTGSAWVPWGPIYPFTAPSDSGFSWINQGSSTISTTKGILHLRGAGTGSADNYVLRVKTAPSTPYTITAYLHSLSPLVRWYAYFLAFRQSSDGKLMVFQFGEEGTTKMAARFVKADSATAYNSDYVSGGYIFYEAPRWLRIADDGTNRKCSVSLDGQNWLELHSVGRTDFLTADQVGFGVVTSHTAAPNHDVLLNVHSWAQG